MMNVFFGRFANQVVPYSVIPFVGRVYNEALRDIRSYEEEQDKQNYIFRRVYAMVEYALANIRFYQDFYRSRGFSLDKLKTFDDISKIPVITKEDLIDVPIEERSVNVPFSSLVNTGGSSGLTLSFRLPQRCRIKSTAYFSTAWKQLGYEKWKVRIQFVARHYEGGIKYDIVRNRIMVSVFEPFGNLLTALKSINKDDIIEYIQGYPSIIYEFALYCAEHEEDFRNSGLKRSLKGVFLNSEYPQTLFREKIEQLFDVRTIANYGHTEAVCLGFDYGDGRYEVMQSYGYSEAVRMDDGIHMVGTTYDNMASPLIRYDTNDIVDEVVVRDGILESFTMSSGGRNGQFVVDRKGQRITVTGLLCGKLRNMLDYCSNVQMAQNEAGITTVYYVPLQYVQNDFEPTTMFDADDIDMDFEFKQIPAPIKTKAGKVLLLVKETDEDSFFWTNNTQG